MQQQIQGLTEVNQNQKHKMMADAADHKATHLFHHCGAVISLILFIVS